MATISIHNSRHDLSKEPAGEGTGSFPAQSPSLLDLPDDVRTHLYKFISRPDELRLGMTLKGARNQNRALYGTYLNMRADDPDCIFGGLALDKSQLHEQIRAALQFFKEVKSVEWVIQKLHTPCRRAEPWFKRLRVKLFKKPSAQTPFDIGILADNPAFIIEIMVFGCNTQHNWYRLHELIAGKEAKLLGISALVQNCKLLVHSIGMNSLEMAENILSNGKCFADVIDPDTEYRPIDFAIDHGNVEILDLLVRHGADINRKVNGVPLIIRAIFARQIQIIHQLLKYPFLDKTVRHENGATILACLVAALGENVNSHEDRFLTESQKPLSKLVQAFSDEGFDFNERSYNLGMPPLIMAISSGKPEFIPLLVKGGAKPNEQIGHGASALHLASSLDQRQAVQALLDAGAIVEIEDFSEETPLHVSVNKGYFHIARMLIRAGANPNKPCMSTTPLHLATIHGYTRLMKLLINAGANLESKTASGYSPLHLAAVSSGSIALQSRCQRQHTKY